MSAAKRIAGKKGRLELVMMLPSVLPNKTISIRVGNPDFPSRLFGKIGEDSSRHGGLVAVEDVRETYSILASKWFANPLGS